MKASRILAASALVLALASCGGGIAHTHVVNANVVAKVTGLEKLGALTSMRESGGVLYLAGQSGLAALSDDGKVLWTLDLPPTLMRLVEADANGVAFTSFELTGVVQAEGLKAFVMGTTGDKPLYTGQTVGLVGKDGKLLWSNVVPSDWAMSAPAMTGDQIAVSRGDKLYSYTRNDGHELFKSPLCTDKSGGSAVLIQSSYNRPVFNNGGWYAAHGNYFVRYDAAGKVLNASRGFGLFTPFQNVTAGPLGVDARVIFGISPWSNKTNAQLFSADKAGAKDWKEEIKDQSSGVSSLTINTTSLFAATNFHVVAFTRAGSMIWDAKNGKGGLYPGSRRGVRYVGNAFASNYALRKSQTTQMVADEHNVYITSGYHKGDVLTVLNAQTGQYVASIDPGALITDLAITSKSLAIATDEGLELISLQ
jgi:outer membrane protein assembly factor BamB